MLIAELMEIFKQEVTSDLDSEAQVMGENTPEHRNGMTKALSPTWLIHGVIGTSFKQEGSRFQLPMY